jgi:tetraacyldisaccharide 4'-kinase
VSAKRPLLLSLTPIYALGVALKNLLRNAGILPTRHLTKPVISIGSLSAGGAGKTPVVIALARLLQLHHHPSDILSRGYGRSSQAVAHVPLDFFASAALYGDEPVEMMRAGLHVFVGADRHAAGKLAEQTHEVAAHLLDDGFQHRQLARALDIVLLTTEDAADHLLPAGNLREPLSALRRADVVILRQEESEQLTPIVQKHTAAEIWLIRRDLVFEEELTRPFAFCGIARPENFLAMLRAAAKTPVGHIIFPDHHPYTEQDIARIVAAAKAANADGIYLTEKDAVKLSQQFHQHLQTVGPVHAPWLRVELVETHAALQTLELVLRSG